MKKAITSGKTVMATFHLHDFQIPPIKDGLVLGKRAPIGCNAMRKALELLHVASFEHIEFSDDVISNILVRKNILRRIPQDKLIRFVVERIKPLMADDEVTHFTVHTEIRLEGEL